jgi:hypothetical protein
MDGVLLVFDSRKLPNLHALTTVPPKPPQQKRNRAVPAFATVILVVVMGLVYYVTIQPKAVQDADIPAIPIAISSSKVAPFIVPAPEWQPQPHPAAEESKSTEVQQAAAAAPAPVPVKKPAVKTSANPPEVKTEPKKEDSKVGSILKKTGRILKKPFKF